MTRPIAVLFRRFCRGALLLAAPVAAVLAAARGASGDVSARAMANR
jgi:hypothetical protein